MTAFQTLEIVDNAYVEVTPIEPQLSYTTIRVARFRLSIKHRPRHILRNNERLKGLVELPDIRDKWEFTLQAYQG